jgi:hypothetical protein
VKLAALASYSKILGSNTSLQNEILVKVHAVSCDEGTERENRYIFTLSSTSELENGG